MKKIAFLGRRSLLSDPGGDTVQLKKTKRYLELNHNLEIDIFTDFHELKNKSEQYDALHIFGMVDVAEYIDVLKYGFSKIYLSSIYVDYFPFAKSNYNFFIKLILNFLGRDGFEYIKNIMKFVLGKKKVSKQYIFRGHKGSIKKLLGSVDLILPNSNSEASRIFVDYKVKNKFYVVPNGIDIKIEKNSSKNILTEDEIIKFKDCILCVGRIEARKGQLDLINAVHGEPYKTFIIGKGAVNQPKYFNSCVQSADSNVEFIDFMPQEKLFEIFKLAKVHVLPSWFETTGLVSLEAMYFGCNIVVTKAGDTLDYFDGKAFFCEPGCSESINKSIKSAMNANKESQSTFISENFTWSLAASKTYDAYLNSRFI
ncbi:D-inositol-3-phosphate glycosyltransferase [Pseudoalteromonas sp. P1-26]|uniref:glycosyltransferase family 4 protein n=1 Tax=Pseudoalteromonas sp. P1-26 TaxID=1723759 RepID=UPI0006D68828|nr:glycosyltransferase [Pseudoalteromonas sp. P1-26]KPZ67178.1 D-inositol-3-phosphate glycosyltransferase [Pseudoalteromonas sp. P1-26]